MSGGTMPEVQIDDDTILARVSTGKALIVSPEVARHFGAALLTSLLIGGSETGGNECPAPKPPAPDA